MKLHQQKPAARGVSQLMYLSDDGTSAESAMVSTPMKVAIAAVLAWLILGGK